MSKLWTLPRPYYLLVTMVLLMPGSGFGGTNALKWNVHSNRVDAEIESWTLEKVLTKVSTATGWRVYLEPGMEKTVSVKFKQLPPGEALRLFLGDLSFAVLPQSNGPSKLFVFRNSLQDATRLLVPSGPDSNGQQRNPLTNELIVTLAPDANTSIDSLAQKLGARVSARIDELHSYRLAFESEAKAQSARTALAENQDIAGLDSNFLIMSPTQTDNLQLSSASFNLKPKVSSENGHVIVGLIDSAVQTLPASMRDFLLPGIQVAGEPNPTSELSHGTSMAETILQGLSITSQESGGSSVRILPVDVYGPHADTTTFDVAKGVYAAINAGATVINLSMGGAGDSQLLADLIEETHDRGVLFFGAAGNDGSIATTYPAAYPDVVAVTAGDRKGNIAPYANRGSFVDVIAPGSSVVQFGNESFLVSGTSSSTAYVSGTAAAYRASGNSSSQVESLLRESLAVRPPAKP